MFKPFSLQAMKSWIEIQIGPLSKYQIIFVSNFQNIFCFNCKILLLELQSNNCTYMNWMLEKFNQAKPLKSWIEISASSPPRKFVPTKAVFRSEQLPSWRQLTYHQPHHENILGKIQQLRQHRLNIKA